MGKRKVTCKGTTQRSGLLAAGQKGSCVLWECTLPTTVTVWVAKASSESSVYRLSQRVKERRKVLQDVWRVVGPAV